MISNGAHFFAPLTPPSAPRSPSAHTHRGARQGGSHPAAEGGSRRLRSGQSSGGRGRSPGILGQDTKTERQRSRKIISRVHMGIFLYLLVIWGNFLDVVLLSNSLIRRDKNTIHWRSEPGNSPHFLRKYFSKSLSFGLCVFGGRQVGSVVV